MIITLADRTEHYLNAERGEKLKAVLLDPNSPEYVQINSVLVKKTYIVKVQDGGQSPEPITDKSKLLDKPEISDEQRAKNLKKLAKIKADFNKKRLNKQSRNGYNKNEQKGGR